MRNFLIVLVLIFTSCSEPEAPAQEVIIVEPTQEIDNRPLTEELPDSGILKGVDPEQIITDDWSDDGELELEIKEK